MKKIIAICGTHGTGKTDLAYRLCTFLKRQGKNCLVLDELARESPFPINKEASNETHVWIITKQITKELQLMNKYEYVITDRSVLDPICYGKVLLDKKQNHTFIKLLPYVVSHINNYYHSTFLLDDSSFNFNVKDNVRDNDLLFRKNIADCFLDMFTAAKIPFTYSFNEDTIFNKFMPCD